MKDLIERQAAIELAMQYCPDDDGTCSKADEDMRNLLDELEDLPSAQGKPFNLPEIYIADGYDTIEGEDGNVGFGVYVPDENRIYVAGDVEGEIRARALLHEICHWVQAVCGRPFDEDEANEFSDIIYDALPSAQLERKKGQWLNIDESEKWKCSVCGRMMWFSPRLGVKPSDYNFCPNCGADMRGEQDG